MLLGSKDDFFGLPIQTELVELPGGHQVYVRMLSAAGQDAFEDMVTLARLEAEDAGLSPERAVVHDYRARMASLFACTQAGEPLFGEADLPRLRLLDHAMLDPIVAAGRRLNGYTQAAVDEIEKNSGADPSGSSGSS